MTTFDYLRRHSAVAKNLYCSSVAFKLDMSKAYDRVEWDFIFFVMKKMGFHDKWVNLIMNCITSLSFSFIVNGTLMGLVNPSRGLRQGWTLSPYLFLLCVEAFSSMILGAKRNNDLMGLRYSTKCPRVTHLFFADDSIVL